jgi:hypothetical protein
MAHFAKLDENDIVLEVNVVHNNVLLDGNGDEREELGIAFLIDIHKHPYWKQTSYNGNFRKNYAGIGYQYDRNRDAFIPPMPPGHWALNEETCQWEPKGVSPKPYPSWTLNRATLEWEPPVPYPGNSEQWNEETQTWDPS